MKENPGKLISILYRKSQIYWSQFLKEYNITSAEYPVLIALNKKDGITQDEIVTRLNVDKSAIARVVQSLADKGFIEKRKDQEDKRCNRVYLTDKGYASKVPIEKGVREWNAILTRNIQDEEMEQIIKLLSQMVTNIQD